MRGCKVFCSRRCRGGPGRFRRMLVGKMVAEGVTECWPRGSRVLVLWVVGAGQDRHGKGLVLSSLGEYKAYERMIFKYPEHDRKQ